MKNRNNIIYWIATVWLSLGMLSTAIVQLLRLEKENEFMLQLGYPVYFLTIIGAWKVLGVIAVLVPKFALLKEWAYAGFFFLTTGAIISHMVRGEVKDIFGPLLLVVLTIVSWYFRPPARRVPQPVLQ